jgi:hypothetical protein
VAEEGAAAGPVAAQGRGEGGDGGGRRGGRHGRRGGASRRRYGGRREGIEWVPRIGVEQRFPL